MLKRHLGYRQNIRLVVHGQDSVRSPFPVADMAVLEHFTDLSFAGIATDK